MTLQAFVGVTDEEWFELLAGPPGLKEANFWQPSGSRGFKALQPGEPFLFSVSNGLLLRADIHTLFDRGYVTVTPDFRVEVSQQIREEFSNGRAYYALHGNCIEQPVSSEFVPASTALQWHNDHVFRG